MKTRNKVSFAAVCVFLIGLVQAQGELTFTVTDLGTLGGNTTTANNLTGHGQNAAGMIVGSSTTSDNSEHAFLYVRDKMYDLNTLCDLSQSGFKVLTVARSISDSCVIIGDGVTANGDKHAFKLTPIGVAGGQWTYECCQWIWKQDGGGWCWESGCGCYKWCGPPGKHPPCPPQPPPCWNWPLPCCPTCPPPVGPPSPPPPPPTYGPPPAPAPPPTVYVPPAPPPPLPRQGCWCCINGKAVYFPSGDCTEGGKYDRECHATEQEALNDIHCHPPGDCWCCIYGQVVHTTKEECLKHDAACYGSEQEARQHCPPQDCWCCIHGQVVHTTKAECMKNDAACYGSREEALRHCQPQDKCWCCINGVPVYGNAEDCKRRGLQCYGSREEALRHCGEQPLCWCCHSGQVSHMTVADCQAREGQCYATEAEAKNHCGSGKPTPTPPIVTTVRPPVTPSPTTTPKIPRRKHSPTPTASPRQTGTPQKPRRSGKLGGRPTTPTPSPVPR